MQIDRTLSVPTGLTAAYVESWAAILLPTDDASAQRLGDCVEETDIPVNLRRRLRPFARMGVTCGLGVAPQSDADIVFCSRYGDVALAHQLLTSLLEGEAMSPAGFSMSVHNTVPGVLDLARKTRIGHTAIAAGTQTLSSGLMEAWLRLAERPHLKLMLVFVDVPLPEIYSEVADFDRGGLAFGLRLSAEAGAHAHVSLMRTQDTGEHGDVLDAPHAELLAREIISRLQGDTLETLRWRSQGSLWSFEGNTDAAA